MYVFREGRRRISSESLRRSLARSLGELLPDQRSPRQSFLIIESLLRAGELESGLADCDHSQQHTACQTTNVLAAQLVSGTAATIPATVLEWLDSLTLPHELSIGVPEGFAYYALHPAQYAELVETLTVPSQSVAVVGIRSIGTTLSAVVKAALEKRGLRAQRITVRPEGHPFDRVTRFSSLQREWIEDQLRRGAHFLVVDEGPGLSGSSFLSTAEALVEAGVRQQSVTLLCAHQPDPARLCAGDAPARIRRFTWCAVPGSTQIPNDAGAFIGSGRWRERFDPGASEWPASWTTLERSKFLSCDERRIHKFEGLGHYGEAVRRRACALSESGFAPPPISNMHGTGYLSYPFLDTTPLDAANPSQRLIESIADYCAFRSRSLAADGDQCQQNLVGLELMLRTNLEEEFGVGADVVVRPLKLVKPVVTDGRMQPWEWGEKNGSLVKFDATSHGDDHLFPGPTDIAWDLAGAIVEFSLTAGNEAAIGPALLRHYRKLTGDDAGERLPSYLLAYSAFRLGYCKMAAQAMQGSSEEPRLLRLYQQYRDLSARLLERRAAA